MYLRLRVYVGAAHETIFLRLLRSVRMCPCVRVVCLTVCLARVRVVVVVVVVVCDLWLRVPPPLAAAAVGVAAVAWMWDGSQDVSMECMRESIGFDLCASVCAIVVVSCSRVLVCV